MLKKRGHLSWGIAVLLTFASAALAEAPPEELVSREVPTEQLFCEGRFCQEDWECQQSCPEARTAVCGSDWTCKYSTGGGGGGGGGFCPASLCAEDWHCVCNGQQGFCTSNNICVY